MMLQLLTCPFPVRLFPLAHFLPQLTFFGSATLSSSLACKHSPSKIVKIISNHREKERKRICNYLEKEWKSKVKKLPLHHRWGECSPYSACTLAPAWRDLILRCYRAISCNFAILLGKLFPCHQKCFSHLSVEVYKHHKVWSTCKSSIPSEPKKV